MYLSDGQVGSNCRKQAMALIAAPEPLIGLRELYNAEKIPVGIL